MSVLSSTDNSLQEAIHFKPLPEVVYQESVTETSSNDDKSLSPTLFQGISLKDYEAQRRMVEEQNKHKKEILCKAIEQQ